MARRSIAISLATLVGCSFVDDFDKFHLGAADDAGAEDARTGLVDGAMNDSGSVTMLDGATVNGAVDAYVQPVCGGTLCDDGDACTIDSCDGSQCVSTIIDADGDGYSPYTCKLGSAAMGGDCDDTKNTVHPGATEVCDGVDNDCNGTIDDGFLKVLCYPDLDRDGYANLDGTHSMQCSTCGDQEVPVADPTDRTKHDCWDDPMTGGEDVFPGQTNYFTRGYGPGGKADRKWDFDCNGKVDTLYRPLIGGGCGALSLLLCVGEQGFTGDPIPACGETGKFVTCAAGLVCSSVEDTREQKCH